MQEDSEKKSGKKTEVYCTTVKKREVQLLIDSEETLTSFWGDTKYLYQLGSCMCINRNVIEFLFFFW